MSDLVLSLFPGIGLLDMAFEQEGFCIVRGPDLLWGGDVRRFHPPAGKFDGVIGGPPCTAHSLLARMVEKRGYKRAEDLIPEFERCVSEARPSWWLMENVRIAPTPRVDGYFMSTLVVNNRWFGAEQSRIRKFWFGCGWRLIEMADYIEQEALETFEWVHTVKARGTVRPGTEHVRGKRPLKDYGFCSTHTVKHSLAAQGLPADWLDLAPFTVEGKQKVIGNGVPLPMGGAIARAVKAALDQLRTERIA
jgi:DNA (cytosine-5)-methyltransferase 1